MRRRLLYALLTMLCCLSAGANTFSDDIYIYRNDGKFNAFLAHEVDSLVYSKKDLKGAEYAEPVVQEVWTADSVYRIPLSVIDSISVSVPQTEYAPKVKRLSPDYLPYINGVDGMTIKVSNDLPYSLRINKGDILLYEGFDDLFPSGFAGKVSSIKSTGNSLDVVCEPAELTEIYDRYVAVGDYVVQRDPQDNRRLLAVPVRKDAALAEFKIPIDFGLDLLSAVSLTGNGEISLSLKVVLNISNGHVYIDFVSKYRLEANIGISIDGKIAKTRFEPATLTLPIVIPNIPILKGGLDFGTFIEGSVDGQAEGGLEVFYESGMSMIYNDGSLSVTRLRPEGDSRFKAKLGLKGYVWTGVLVEPSIRVIGNLVDLGFVNGIGPCLEFDIAGNLLTDTGRMYERLKDSEYSLSVKLASSLRTSNIFSDKSNLTGVSELSFLKSTFYLLPQFEQTEIETDKNSITVNTTVTRDMLMPCDVGFKLLDEEENEVETWYSSEQKNIAAPALKIGHTFDKNLKQGVKYTVRPVVRLWNVELDAMPDKECYLDCNIVTGKSFAILNGFEANGVVETPVGENVEAGFVYTSVKTNPRHENAKSVKAVFTDDKTFKAGVSGLQEGTTYYYCAYIINDGKCHYGDTQCITTKRNIDMSDDDNFGGDYTSDSSPLAETGKSSDIERTAAKIALTFNKVSPNTECGYYLQADSKKAGTLSSKYYSLGTVTGRQTVELKDLIPGTSYRYWAVEKNNNGKSVAMERSFETEPSPAPVSKVLEVTDVEMQSATVVCYFDNVDFAEECGIEYKDGEFAYRKKATPGPDGKAEIKLSKLTAETSYSVKSYVKRIEDDEPSFNESATTFTTAQPDVLGWWKFDSGAGYAYSGPPFDLELRNNGRTNSFWGVNYLFWQRESRKITMQQSVSANSSSYFEYRGEFNEDFTRVTGTVYHVYNNTIHDVYEDNVAGTFYMSRNKSKDDQ